MNLRKYLGLSAASLAFAIPLSVSSVARAETHGYVISWFATATYNLDRKASCPENRNGGRTENYHRQLTQIGYTEAEADEIMKTQGGTLEAKYETRVATRGSVNGKPAIIYNYPESVADPNIETVVGKIAYGFDLGVKNDKMKFEDPDTHQKIDNQLWRAVGCTHSFDTNPPDRPYFEDLTWHLMIDSAPAWSVMLTGDDLSKDGKVTITMDLLTQHLKRDAAGNVLTGATYVIDSGPRSHNVLQGEIKNGVLSITPKDIYLEGEMPFYAEIAMHDTHMRINMKSPDGTLSGYWGGFLDWQRYAYMYTARPVNGQDVVGMWHALKKFADADPDPKTGQNRMISATWRMEAVPAFLATEEGKLVASPVPVSTAPQPEKVAAAPTN